MNLAKIVIAISLFLPVFGDDLNSQLRQLRQAEQEGILAQQKEAQLKQQAIERAKKKAEAAKAAQIARKQKLEEKKYEEYLADKKRDQDYEDLKRQIEIEDLRAQLEEKKALSKAKAKHADDFVNEELNRQKANTDVVQSKADATRSVSRGVENFLTPKKEEKKSSWFF